MEHAVQVSTEHERSPARAEREARAKQVCHGCPVIEDCRNHALRMREPYGVWGALGEALAAFHPTGDVLELACGPGTWTPQLLQHATTVTAAAAADAEMLALAQTRVGADRVRFLRADLFTWRPGRRCDVAFHRRLPNR